ncbi:MAG: TrmB family transcriptional regulator [Nanoarchaeota archaeon]
MDLKKSLQEAGLTGNEAKVYLELIQRGDLPASQIAKRLGIDRTLSYTILNHLIEKGHVKYVQKHNKKYFSCANPESLLNSIQAKEMIVQDLVKKLKNIEQRTPNPIEVGVYEGRQAVRNFVRMVMECQGFLSYGATGKAFYSLYEMPAITTLIKERELDIRIIGHKKHRNEEPFEIPGVMYRFTDVDSHATTSIFGEYVTIHLIDNKPYFVLIKNKEIADSYRSHFKMMWEIAEE